MAGRGLDFHPGHPILPRPRFLTCNPNCRCMSPLAWHREPGLPTPSSSTAGPMRAGHAPTVQLAQILSRPPLGLPLDTHRKGLWEAHEGPAPRWSSVHPPIYSERENSKLGKTDFPSLGHLLRAQGDANSGPGAIRWSLPTHSPRVSAEVLGGSPAPAPSQPQSLRRRVMVY